MSVDIFEQFRVVKSGLPLMSRVSRKLLLQFIVLSSGHLVTLIDVILSELHIIDSNSGLFVKSNVSIVPESVKSFK